MRIATFEEKEKSMTDEKELEAKIKAKNLNAPRLTPAHIDAQIVDEKYHVMFDTYTVCTLKLKNGFCVSGTSACASPSNFDAEIGRELARANARNKIWELEGYLLRSQLANIAAVDPDHWPLTGRDEPSTSE